MPRQECGNVKRRGNTRTKVTPHRNFPMVQTIEGNNQIQPSFTPIRNCPHCGGNVLITRGGLGCQHCLWSEAAS